MTNIDHFIELKQDAEVAEASGRPESADRYHQLADHVYLKMSKEEKIIVDIVLKHMKDAELISTIEI